MCVVSQLSSDAKATSIAKNLMATSGWYPWHQTVVQMKTQICYSVCSMVGIKQGMFCDKNTTGFCTLTTVCTM